MDTTNQIITHLDLFSGIGGFAYAIDQVWDNVEHIFCEIDPFCRAVLNKHWKGSKIYGDIKEITANSKCDGCKVGYTEREREERESEERWLFKSKRGDSSCDILTGGFPCQPFSQAGNRKGKDDDRHLWPEMLRVIQLVQPTWIVAENVRGLLTIEQGMVFEQMCLDLEKESYEIQAFNIPAVAVNAPHRRERIWVIALHSPSNGCRESKTSKDEEGCSKESRETWELEGGFERPHSSDTNSTSERLEREMRKEQSRCSGRCSTFGGGEFQSWNKNWFEVAAELCGVDDGLSTELDGFKLSKAKHRTERIKSLGNSIVPQIAMEIFRAIKATQEINRS